jgi:hypothetical protein
MCTGGIGLANIQIDMYIIKIGRTYLNRKEVEHPLIYHPHSHMGVVTEFLPCMWILFKGVKNYILNDLASIIINHD